MKQQNKNAAGRHGWAAQTRGASVSEYAILGALVAVAAIVTVVGFGDRVSSTFNNVTSEVGNNQVAMAPSAPGAGTPPPATPEETCTDQVYYPMGYDAVYVELQSNIWNPPTGVDYSVCLDEPAVDAAPTALQPWTWDWDIAGNSYDVIAYPEAVFGIKPWSEAGGTAATADTIDARPITLDYSYALTSQDSIHNVAVSTWLTENGQASSSDVTDEVMIWVENSSVYPAGSVIASGITIDGRSYDLYNQNNMGDASGGSGASWNYWAFVANSTARSGSLSIDAFFDYLITQGHVPATRYASAIEFGTEVASGTGAMVVDTLAVTGLEPPTTGVQPFTFGSETIAWDAEMRRAYPPYVDIVGLDGDPLPYTISSSSGRGDPVAESNATYNPDGVSGTLIWGTNISVLTPSPGDTEIVTLTVDGVSGTYEITREPVGDPNAFSLTSNNGTTWAQIDYSAIGVYDLPYEVSVSGTGGTNPYFEDADGNPQTAGYTPQWGVDIRITEPPTGQTETITLDIEGQIITWTVTGT